MLDYELLFPCLITSPKQQNCCDTDLFADYSCRTSSLVQTQLMLLFRMCTISFSYIMCNYLIALWIKIKTITGVQ